MNRTDIERLYTDVKACRLRLRDPTNLSAVEREHLKRIMEQAKRALARRGYPVV